MSHQDAVTVLKICPMDPEVEKEYVEKLCNEQQERFEKRKGKKIRKKEKVIYMHLRCFVS